MSPKLAHTPICFAYPQPNVVSTYRCYHHYRMARSLGFDASMYAQITPELLEEHDVFAFVSPVSPDVAVAAEWMRSHGKRIWFDVPDDLFSAYYDEIPTPEQRQALEYERSFARYADVVTASNEFVTAQARGINERAFTVPNYIDERVWQVPIPSKRASFGIPEGAVTLGWAGSVDEVRSLREVELAIGGVMRDFPETLFVSVGDDPRLGTLPPERCRHLPVRGMDEYVDFLHHIDIAVVGAPTDLSGKSLSDLRLLEHGMAGSAAVASRVRPYETLAENVSDLALATTETEWIDALTHLVANKVARGKAGAALNTHVSGTRLLDANAEACREPIETLYGLVGQDGSSR